MASSGGDGRGERVSSGRRPARPPRPVAATIVEPFRRFAALEASGSLVLLAATAVALVWANLPSAGRYFALLEAPAGLRLGGFTLEKTVHHWINDGLMAIFFFVVGLEIKREVLVGDLASPRKAALPLAAALGGMLAPAALYAAAQRRRPGRPRLGHPDGHRHRLRPRRPGAGGRPPEHRSASRSSSPPWRSPTTSAPCSSSRCSTPRPSTGPCSPPPARSSRCSSRRTAPASAGRCSTPCVGIVVWYCVLASGVHATVAGVLLAFTIPVWTRIDLGELVARGRHLLDALARYDEPGADRLTDEGQQGAIEALERSCEQAQAPLQRLEHLLHGWVAFVVLPIFAFANAGVALGGGGREALLDPVTLGVVLGLVVGKPVGILLFSWAAVRLGLAALPAGVTFRQLAGVGCLGGIGFTMSLFIAGLAFGDPARLDAAKIGILAASLVSGVVGWLLLRRVSRG